MPIYPYRAPSHRSPFRGAYALPQNPLAGKLLVGWIGNNPGWVFGRRNGFGTDTVSAAGFPIGVGPDGVGFNEPTTGRGIQFPQDAFKGSNNGYASFVRMRYGDTAAVQGWLSAMGPQTDSYGHSSSSSKHPTLNIHAVVIAGTLVTFVDTHDYSYGISYRRASQATFDVLDLTTNLRVVETISSATAPTISAVNCGIGIDVDTSDEQDKDITCAFLFDGELTFDEFTALHKDPYHFLRN